MTMQECLNIIEKLTTDPKQLQAQMLGKSYFGTNNEPYFVITNIYTATNPGYTIIDRNNTCSYWMPKAMNCDPYRITSDLQVYRLESGHKPEEVFA